jgi:hypothetical protein
MMVTRAIAILFVVLAATPPAGAEIGPCRPDTFKGLTCGSGSGAARVIEKTLSPDKTLAFAWRNPKGEPTDQPDPDDALDLLLLRLSDGAVLARSATEHWATGEAHANRRDEYAIWSPDGRFVLRIAERRFDTGALDLFVLAADGKSAASVDLKKIIAVTMWVPKDGPEENFKVTLQVTRGERGPAARLVTVAKAKAAP